MNCSETIELKVLLGGEGFPAFSGACVYIQSGNKKIIVDTGASNRKDNLLAMLHQIGVGADEISDVIISHMHADHFGNLDLFPNARILMSEKEFIAYKFVLIQKEQGGKKRVTEYWRSMNNWKRMANNSLITPLEDIIYETIQDFTENQKERISFVQPGQLIAPSVHIVEFYGHSAGQIGVFIETKKENYLIAADAMPNKRWFERTRDGIIYSQNESEKYDLNFKIIASLGQSIIIPGHDKPFSSQSCEYRLDILMCH